MSEPATTASPAVVKTQIPQKRESRLVAAAFFALYLGVGAVLVLHYGSMVGDAMSRVANGSFVIRSADPHLSAIGFVWNPLPSLLAIPLLLISGLWPPLLTQAFAGNVLSAACMAAAVAVLNRLLADLGLRRGTRLTLTILFGTTPMIIYYGANGMSEAYLLLSQVVAVRGLLSWTRTRDWRPLVVTGLALGIGYLARYEAVATAAGAVVFVVLVTIRGSSGPLSARLRTAWADVWLVGSPAAFAFVLWAALSWVIVGQPFAQFTSSYGNSSQVAQQNINTHSLEPYSATHFILAGTQIVALEPFLLLLALAALVLVVRRKDDSLLAAFAIFLPVLLFQAFAAISGGTFGWLRFYIDTIPLAVVLLALLLVRKAGARAVAPRTRVGIALGVGAVMLAPFVSQAVVVQHARLAAEEEPVVGLVLHPAGREAAGVRDRYRRNEQIARYLDAQRLPEQSVLVDVASGFDIVLASKRPRSFVITTDRQFAAALDGVGDDQVRFVLDIPDDGLGRANAVNVRFPSFYRDGAGVAVLVRQFAPGGDQPAWRLYRVQGRPSGQIFDQAARSPRGIAPVSKEQPFQHY